MKKLIIILSFFSVFVVGFLILANWDNLILDNKKSGYSCTQLPPKAYLEQLLRENQQLITNIKSVSNSVQINVDDTRCSRNKAELLISYGSHEDRKKIEQLIKNSPLANLPISYINT